MSKNKNEISKIFLFVSFIGIGVCMMTAHRLMPDAYLFEFLIGAFIIAILLELTMLGVDKLVANE